MACTTKGTWGVTRKQTDVWREAREALANQSNANPSTRIMNTRREERNVFDGYDENSQAHVLNIFSPVKFLSVTLDWDWVCLFINLSPAAWFGPVIFQKARVKFECIPFFLFSLTAPGKELQPECYQTLYETLGANYSCCKSWDVPHPLFHFNATQFKSHKCLNMES